MVSGGYCTIAQKSLCPGNAVALSAQNWNTRSKSQAFIQLRHTDTQTRQLYAPALIMSTNASHRRSSTFAVDIGADWLEYIDDDTQRPYYMNQVTQEVTWDHPFPQNESRMSLELPPPLPNEGVFEVDGTAEDEGGIDLPPGWSQWTDASGELYYTHEDGMSTWTRPCATEFQQPSPTCADSIDTDVVTLMRETTLDSAQSSLSNDVSTSVPPVSDSKPAFAQRTPPPVPPRVWHVSNPLSTAAASPTDSWSAGSAANLEALLQPFPSVLSKLRAKLKSDHLPAHHHVSSQPVPFAWYTIGATARHQPVALDADIFAMGASLYYQSRGSLFKKSRTIEESLSYEASPSSKPTLEANRDAGESIVGLCRRCCLLVMLYMGDSDLSDMDKDLYKEKDKAINAASGSSRLVLIFREIFDMVRSSVQLADEAYARVLKQLCNNYRASSVEAGWSLLLLLCSHVACSDVIMRFLVMILNKCLLVERDLISRSVPNHSFAAHVVMLTLSYRSTARANGDLLSQFVDSEVENSFRKLKHLSPLYSFIDEIMQLETKFHPVTSDFEILSYLPSTLVLLTDLIHARGGFQTDGIFRLAGERSCVSRVRASISCRYPIVAADADPLVIAEVGSDVVVQIAVIHVYVENCDPNHQVFKQWLREFPCPVIPTKLHGQCTVYAGKAPSEVTPAAH
jgi:hypothetical protein